MSGECARSSLNLGIGTLVFISLQGFGFHPFGIRQYQYSQFTAIDATIAAMLLGGLPSCKICIISYLVLSNAGKIL